MLRIKDVQVEQKPRKRVKLDTVNFDQYDEFKGEAIQQEDKPIGELSYETANATQEIKAYSKILETIKKNPKPHKKIQLKQSQTKIKQQSQQKNSKVESVKNEKQPIVKVEKQQKKKHQKKQKQIPVSSNWKAFLEKQKESNSTNKHWKEGGKKYYEFVAIDCEFVKSGEEQCLARVSLVNEHNDNIYDSYVKPIKKITDYLTQISGITYSHIKNAPNQDHVIQEIKRKMLNKIVVGHTIFKDLEVCGLKNWSGFKKVIDIAEAHAYSPGGKRVALKKLSFNHLGRVIQQGWHSSCEDASATMQLFLKNKLQILKENKIVKS